MVWKQMSRYWNRHSDRGCGCPEWCMSTILETLLSHTPKSCVFPLAVTLHFLLIPKPHSAPSKWSLWLTSFILHSVLKVARYCSLTVLHFYYQIIFHVEWNGQTPVTKSMDIWIVSIHVFTLRNKPAIDIRMLFYMWK